MAVLLIADNGCAGTWFCVAIVPARVRGFAGALDARRAHVLQSRTAPRGGTQDSDRSSPEETFMAHMARGLLAFVLRAFAALPAGAQGYPDRKSTRLNSSHLGISYAVFCLKK